MIAQCPYFPAGREMAVIFPESGGCKVASVPYINVIGDTLGKRIKLYDFENADYDVPAFTQASMIARQLRIIGAKTGVYEELHAMFYQHTQNGRLAA